MTNNADWQEAQDPELSAYFDVLLPLMNETHVPAPEHKELIWSRIDSRLEQQIRADKARRFKKMFLSATAGAACICLLFAGVGAIRMNQICHETDQYLQEYMMGGYGEHLEAFYKTGQSF